MFLKKIKAMQNGMVLNGGRNQMFTPGLPQPRRAQDGKVIGFRSAAREDDFAGFSAQKLRRTVARVIQESPRPPADMMDARGIAPNIAQKRQHRVAHRRVQRGRRIVIQVNRTWHLWYSRRRAT